MVFAADGDILHNVCVNTALAPKLEDVSCLVPSMFLSPCGHSISFRRWTNAGLPWTTSYTVLCILHQGCKYKAIVYHWTFLLYRGHCHGHEHRTGSLVCVCVLCLFLFWFWGAERGGMCVCVCGCLLVTPPSESTLWGRSSRLLTSAGVWKPSVSGDPLQFPKQCLSPLASASWLPPAPPHPLRNGECLMGASCEDKCWTLVLSCLEFPAERGAGINSVQELPGESQDPAQPNVTSTLINNGLLYRMMCCIG